MRPQVTPGQVIQYTGRHSAADTFDAALARYDAVAYMRALLTGNFVDVGREVEVGQELRRIAARTPRFQYNSNAHLMPFVSRASLTIAAEPEAVHTRPGPRYAGLYPRAHVFALGAVHNPSGVPSRVVSQSAGLTVAMTAESPGSDGADTLPTFVAAGSSALKSMQAVVRYSGTLEAQTGGEYAVAPLIVDELNRAIGSKADSQAITGSGAGNNCTGLLNWSGVTGPTSGGTFDADVVLEAEQQVADANADVEGAKLGVLTTGRLRRMGRATTLGASGGGVIWMSNDMVLGDYPGRVSTNVPSNLGAGTNAHAWIFGDWSSLVITTSPFVEVLVDRVSQAGQDVVRAIGRYLIDVSVARTSAFAPITDIVPA